MKSADSFKGLEGTSFSRETFKMRHRLIGIVDGGEGTGKTTLGLSMAELGPIVYFGADPNYDGPLRAAQKKYPGRIFPAFYEWAPPDTDDVNKIADSARPVRKRFDADYGAFLRSPNLIGGVIDTASFVWQLDRNATYGKLTQVPPILYAQVNAIFLNRLARARSSNKNVLFLHRMEEEWKTDPKTKKSNPTGKMKRQGMKMVGFDANLIVRLDRERLHGEGVFEPGTGPITMRIRKCTPNGDLVDLLLKGKSINFKNLFNMVFSDDEEDDE